MNDLIPESIGRDDGMGLGGWGGGLVIVEVADSKYQKDWSTNQVQNKMTL